MFVVIRRHPSTLPTNAGASPLANLLMPGRRELQRAAALSVIAAMLWPLQAALVAYALGGLVSGVKVSGTIAALGFVVLGALRAGLVLISEAKTDTAAEIIIRSARARIVMTEAERSSDSPFGGAGSISALAGEKLDMIAPYVARYAPARARVMILPLAILALALWQSWVVALVLAISGPLIPIFMALVGMAAKETSRRQMAEIGTLNDLLVDRLAALVDIRALGANQTVMTGFSKQAQDLRERTMATLRVAFLSSTVLELFSAIGVAMVAVYVGFSLLGALNFGAWSSGLSPEAGIFLLLLAPEFFQPLRDLSAAWHDKAAAEAVANELVDWEAAKTHRLLGQGAHDVPLTGPATISLRGCVLPNGKILNDIDIAAGESVALVGPSGAGKTSALRLIAGLLSPQSGKVIVAGQTLDTKTADPWRARLGWMPQSPHFFNASIKYNLMLGREGCQEDALTQAAVIDVINAMPQGLNTRLGETGGGLSGGEARRLTLARAIYGAPDVILADEPTADLDAATAKAVAQGLLAQMARGTTLIVATHDPALAAQMGRIIHLEALS